MKFIVTYIAGFLSAVLVLTGFIQGQLWLNLIIAVAITTAASVLCHKRHKRKQEEYYNRFRSKNGY